MSGRRTRWLVGVDVGGTFTDVVAIATDGRRLVAKVPSTPDDPAEGFLTGLDELVAAGVEPGDVSLLFHGTTVATNALLTGRTARAVLLATAGFRDVLGHRGGRRPRMYDLEQPRPRELIARRDRLDVRERIAAEGTVLEPLDEAEVGRLLDEVAVRRPEAVAIALLFGYVDDRHERRLEEALLARFPGLPVSRSSAVAREFREYPRTATTALNAVLRPVVGRYLLSAAEAIRGRGVRAALLVMTSSGGSLRAPRAEAEAHRLVLSGPAAGVAGAAAVAVACGVGRAIALDMGGTSVDVCLVEGGRAPMATLQEIEGQPILAPTIEMATAGAGGGSIAWIDAGGSLKVGPQSAGADPGPAAYGRGGREATVTDAHVVVGTLGERTPLAGRLVLDRGAAGEAVGRLAGRLGLSVDVTAEGIIAVATAHLARAIRSVSVARGVDPRGCTLVAFGGAGPLHAARLLRELRLPAAIVPLHPGLLSAAGLMAADLRVDEAQTMLRVLEPAALEELVAWFAAARHRIDERLGDDGIASGRRRYLAAADCRYVGQGYELSVPLDGTGAAALRRLAEAFHAIHRTTYGHAAPDEPVEVVTLRLSGSGALPRPAERELAAGSGRPATDALHERRALLLPGRRTRRPVPAYRRERLRPGDRIPGPAIVEQLDATTVVLAGQEARVDRRGNLLLAEADA